MRLNLPKITLDDALNDPDPLFSFAGATCRSCGAVFLDQNGKRLCDVCLVERVNGAGELEDDDPDDVINRVPAWISIAPAFWAIVRDYWREEVRLGCRTSLERLERICRERGWDYQATMRALS